MFIPLLQQFIYFLTSTIFLCGKGIVDPTEPTHPTGFNNEAKTDSQEQQSHPRTNTKLNNYCGTYKIIVGSESIMIEERLKHRENNKN